MPQKTNLNINPFFDDFDKNDNFYRVLFKPGFPVQARELTQLQSILQNQVESFGSHMFKEGSMVIPGNITYNDAYSAVKINPDHLGIDVTVYTKQLHGKTIRGQSSGVVATIDDCRFPTDGPEYTDITLYVNYSTSGTDNEVSSFEDGEILIVEDYQCVSADGLSSQEAAMAEPLAVCLHAIKQAGKILGKKVLVTGSGPIGTLCVAAARRAGAEEIIVTDISTNALSFSNSVGADRVINVLKEHDQLKNYQFNKGYFDIAIECSGSAQGISDSINCLKPKGTLIQLGLGGDVLIPLVSVTTKELNLKGSFRFHSEFELAVEMMKKKLIDVNPLITHKIEFKNAIDGFELAMNKNKKSMKVQLAF